MPTVFANFEDACKRAQAEMHAGVRDIRFNRMPSGGWIIQITETIITDRMVE